VPIKHKYTRRKLYATWRDSWLLLKQFKFTLLSFCAIILSAGVIYYLLSLSTTTPSANLVEAIYQVLSLTFLQPMGEFPSAWYLEIFYFIMPLAGIIFLAQGIADFGYMFFNRRTRQKEWETAVASTFNNHIILIGLGHLGFRVVRSLVRMEQDVVVIELDPSRDLIENTQSLGVPVIADDATRQTTLEAAGIARARAIILCTQNDSLNLQIAVKARSLNPRIKVVVRIFDDDFASALHDQFGYTALSATGMAAPAFAAAAAGVDFTRPITIEGKALSLARMDLNPANRLVGKTIGEIERDFEVSVVLWSNQTEKDLHPAASRRLASGDVLAVLGGQEELNDLIFQNNQPAG
jgi:Trk K+ transport system NAD-binding subunit